MLENLQHQTKSTKWQIVGVSYESGGGQPQNPKPNTQLHNWICEPQITPVRSYLTRSLIGEIEQTASRYASPDGIVWMIVVHEKRYIVLLLSPFTTVEMLVALAAKVMVVLPPLRILFLAESMSLVSELANKNEYEKFVLLSLLAS